jgi:hypothetical protein
VNLLFLAGCTLAVAPTIWFQRFDGMSILGLILMGVTAFIIMARRANR